MVSENEDDGCDYDDAHNDDVAHKLQTRTHRALSNAGHRVTTQHMNKPCPRRTEAMVAATTGDQRPTQKKQHKGPKALPRKGAQVPIGLTSKTRPLLVPL